jgi:uncharacterized protein YkwD
MWKHAHAALASRLAISVLGLAIVLLPALTGGSVPHLLLAPRLASSSPWLDRLNAWRASTGLSSLTENPTWSQGDYDHALYMVKNDLVTHYETPGTPYYSVAGDTAAKNSNLYVSSSTSTTDAQAIDWWMQAPFHAMGMMDPRLTQAGFGSYREVKSGWDMGAGLDVISGNPFTGGRFPVYYPGNLATEPLTSYTGNEWPDPLQACPGYSAPTGLPVFIEVGGNVTTRASSVHSFTGNGVALDHCVIDSSNSALSSFLYTRGGVILIPRQPLQTGVNYMVALAVNNVPYTWSFSIGPLGTSCSVGAAGAPTVTSVNPSSGSTAGGSAVTVSGCGFTGATGVKFGTSAATSFTFVSDSQLTAVSPVEAAGIVDVTVTTLSGASATSGADTFQFTPPGLYNPQAPLRVLDTRTGSPIGPGASINLQLGGTKVPANATSVVLNVTATETTANGWLTVYPTGGQLPNASNLNWVASETVANLVQVNLGTSGQITINNAAGYTHVIADLEGYYAPPGGSTAGGFTPLSPARVTDTRSGSGQLNAGLTLHAGATLNVQITGQGGIPGTGVSAVVLNTTVTNTTSSSWLTAYPAGTSQPVSSNLNWTASSTVANRVIVPVGAGGKLSFYNAGGSTDLIIDANGYFTDSTASGSTNMGVTPARILDTRNGTGGVIGKVGAGATITLTVAGVGGVPAMVSSTPPTAVVINVTVTHATTPNAGWLTIWPDQAAMPTESDLNFVSGQTVPNLVVVKVPSTGKIQINNATGSTDVLVDVVGWFG